MVLMAAMTSAVWGAVAIGVAIGLIVLAVDLIL